MRIGYEGDAMRFLILSLLYLLPRFAFAGNMDIYGGFGLTGGVSQFSISSPESAISKFSTLGYLVESGFTMGDKWGLLGGAELGQLQANNTISSSTYLEAAKSTFYTLKLGMFFNGLGGTGFGFGAGYRISDWNVKSISLNNNRYNDIRYQGTDTVLYGNLNLDMNKRYRTTIEIQNVTGKLTSKSSTASDIKHSEILLSLRFFVLFN